MNYYRKRDPAVAEAAAEHRRREDAAPRLREEVPNLLTLRLSFEDVRTPEHMQALAYVRPVVVAQAPAYFEVRCMEPRCDGRHDLTNPIVQALKKRTPKLTAENPCDGMVAGTPCNRVLAYTIEATFKP